MGAQSKVLLESEMIIMPRIARKSMDTSFFHVIVQGINKEYIFYKDRYIERYLEFLDMYYKNYQIEIVAYCIMNNHAHMLIYTNEIEEMSKFMHIVNTSYAQYYNHMENNRVGYVFRSRYLSEPICDKRYLIKCIQYIHLNPVKAHMVNKCADYKYSTYNQYLKNKDKIEINCLKDVLCRNDYNIILENEENTDIFMDVNISKDQILESRIEEFEKNTNKSMKEILNNKTEARKLVKYLKEGYRINYTDIMKKLNISRWKMESLRS